jgi:hypothetical protein
MRVVAIRYTNQIPKMTAFYEVLGLQVDTASRTGAWVELTDGHGTVALHEPGAEDAFRAAASSAVAATHSAGDAEVALEADEPLEAIRARLDAAGFPGAAIVDESYGRSLRTKDPDGVPLWVNESDRELFT